MLHTHLAIKPTPGKSALSNVSIHGLHGASYLDRLDEGKQRSENAVSSRDPDTGDYARGLGGLRFDKGGDTSRVDRVYLAGTGYLGTFTAAEIHVGPPIPGTPGQFKPSTSLPPPTDGAQGDRPASNVGVASGVTTVEATCSRAAMATWGDNTPSPDMLVCGGGNNQGVLCVSPGLISSPITSLVNGRMTLTQTITHHSDDH